mmetsp:Transcript_41667/g.65027  ORF Transcript_41667/g.65027 Transcript_41667/m.65027 type:complete len:184 (+) Transcript_41667:109-660(+)
MTAIGLALFASLMESIRTVMTEFLLSGIKMQLLENLYWLMPASAVCLLVSGLVIEGPKMYQSGDYERIAEKPHLFLLGAILGFGVTVLSTAVIQATSATSLKVLSLVRNTIPVFYAIWVYKEPITANQLMGYTMSVLSFAAYTYFKTNEAAQKNKAPTQAVSGNQTITLERPGASSSGTIPDK